MAAKDKDEKTKTPVPPHMQVEVGDGKETGGSVTMGERSQSTTDEAGKSGTVEFGAGKATDAANNPLTNKPADDQKQEGTDADQQEGDQQEGDQQEGGDEKTEDTAEDGKLPEFKADDPDTVAKYDAKYKKDGQFQLGALSDEFWQNAQTHEEGQGSLNPDTYKYLAAQGYDEAFVKQVEAGQVALVNQTWQGYFTRAGGKANFDKAFKWATEGTGYSKEQKEAFNKALDAGGETANDAVDLLMSRHAKADGTRLNPGSSVEGGANGGGKPGGAKPASFATRDEWVAARKEAGSDMLKQQEVSDKFRRSKPQNKGW